MSNLDKYIERAKKIIEQNGSCSGISCLECPIEESCGTIRGDDYVHEATKWLAENTCSATTENTSNDPVNHPAHYAERVPNIEAIEVTQHFNFNRGNAIKYIWLAGSKGGLDKEIDDLKKARWYIEKEIDRLKNE
jgi:hypothetical protein